jgi:hypothetical protein
MDMKTKNRIVEQFYEHEKKHGVFPNVLMISPTLLDSKGIQDDIFIAEHRVHVIVEKYLEPNTLVLQYKYPEVIDEYKKTPKEEDIMKALEDMARRNPRRAFRLAKTLLYDFFEGEENEL